MPKRLKIAARDNPKLKFARRVRDGREAENFVFIEGLRLAEEIINTGHRVNIAFLDPTASRDERLKSITEKLDSAGVQIAEISDSLISSISDTQNPQGIILIAERPGGSMESLSRELIATAPAPAVYFSAINNPLNLGAAIRSAAAAGSPAVFTSPSSADAFSAKANRAAMGANFHVPVVEKVPLPSVLEFIENLGLLSAAAVVNSPNEYTEIDWRSIGLVVFGSEAHGLAAAELEKIPRSFTIPMQNGVESLNLAVSAAVAVFEARRQRLLRPSA